MEILEKEKKLYALLAELGSVLVAFSAGVDSSCLLAAAVHVLGPDRVQAVTSATCSLPERERCEAVALARSLGVRHQFVDTDEFSVQGFVQNGPERCFYCKDALFRALRPIAQAQGLSAIVYGATADDLGDYRPGMRAAAEHSIRAPLLEAGLGKVEIRELSLKLGLTSFDKPAMACLASRIPYGSAVTPEKLKQVEVTEKFLKEELGLRRVRVRHHGAVARIEVDPQDLVRLVEQNCRQELVQRVKAAGFAYVTLDLEGFRSGSLNEVLSGSV